MLRTYFVNESGDEKTLAFATEGMAYAITDSIFHNKPSQRYWQTLEPTEIVEVDFFEAINLAENNVELFKLRVQVLEHLLLDAVQRLESFVRDSPKKRYANLIEEKNDLVHRIPDKYIASYIGVTPVKLSRIRKRLTKK